MVYLRRFSVAPMLKLTDRHCRYFHRQFSKHTLLYTEMVTTKAILNSKADYLSYNQEEHPIALQLAGNKPAELAKCAKLAELHGYDEINFNVGCPSDRMQKNKFGVCMMVDAALVSDCVKSMLDVVNIPVTVKTRIGIDEQDSYEFLCNFIGIVSQLGGCDTFIIHARKACLSGLTPQKNRTIPSLDYLRVHQLKRDFMALTIVINGGIKTLTEAKLHLQHVDGVMIGRAAYYNPIILNQVDNEIFGCKTLMLTPGEVIRLMYPYIEKELAKGTYLCHITRHILGLVKGIPEARRFRRYLSQNMYKPGANINMLETALMLYYA